MDVFVGITGASGAPYARRLVQALVAGGHTVGACFSGAATQVSGQELYGDLRMPRGEVIDRWPIERGRDVIVDLSTSHFHGSVLLGLIINIRTRTRAGGGELIVVAASPGLMQVVRTANLDRLIVMVPTRAQALARL